MPDVLLLRFRDLTPGVKTVITHNEIANLKGKVLWGWWKKPLELMPDPGLTVLASDLRPDSKVFLVDSATARIYRADLLKIHFSREEKNNPLLIPIFARNIIVLNIYRHGLRSARSRKVPYHLIASQVMCFPTIIVLRRNSLRPHFPILLLVSQC